MLIALLILYFIFGVGILVCIVYCLNSVFGGLDFATSGSAISTAAKVVLMEGKQESNFVDLGCARGNFVIKIARQCPKLRVMGVDNDSLRIFFARCRALGFLGKVRFKKADLFNFDVSKADVIYIYLDRFLMPRLQDKLQHELRPGSIVITNTVVFPSWQPVQAYITNTREPEKQKLFIYKL